jgi:hypothetical protein
MASLNGHDARRRVPWPLRSLASATIALTELQDGRRRIVIHHKELKDVTPQMLEWWFSHVVGKTEFADRHWSYLVWDPVDYEVLNTATAADAVAPGTRLRVREAFQLDVTVDVERVDYQVAIIGGRLLGLNVLRLVNSFTPSTTGTLYETDITIGSNSWIGRLGLNHLMRGRVLAEDPRVWVRHHIEQVGTLENFLPALYRAAAPARLPNVR